MQLNYWTVHLEICTLVLCAIELFEVCVLWWRKETFRSCAICTNFPIININRTCQFRKNEWHQSVYDKETRYVRASDCDTKQQTINCLQLNWLKVKSDVLGSQRGVKTMHEYCDLLTFFFLSVFFSFRAGRSFGISERKTFVEKVRCYF